MNLLYSQKRLERVTLAAAALPWAMGQAMSTMAAQAGNKAIAASSGGQVNVQVDVGAVLSMAAAVAVRQADAVLQAMDATGPGDRDGGKN